MASVLAVLVDKTGESGPLPVSFRAKLPNSPNSPAAASGPERS